MPMTVLCIFSVRISAKVTTKIMDDSINVIEVGDIAAAAPCPVITPYLL
ncbi:MAG: hypothetical protein C5S40_00555 [ANME-2 cluster archaeon]|nr:hypothetical protein [ANME-2 cluster archaeon]